MQAMAPRSATWTARSEGSVEPARLLALGLVLASAAGGYYVAGKHGYNELAGAGVGALVGLLLPKVI